MKLILETRRADYIIYLRLYYKIVENNGEPLQITRYRRGR